MICAEICRNKRQNKRSRKISNEQNADSVASTKKETVRKQGDFVWDFQQKTERRPVTKGANDEINYQILSGLSENDSVVTNMKTVTKKEEANTQSPFMQGPPGGKMR